MSVHDAVARSFSAQAPRVNPASARISAIEPTTMSYTVAGSWGAVHASAAVIDAFLGLPSRGALEVP